MIQCYLGKICVFSLVIGMYDCTFDVKNDPFCLWKHDESAEFRFQRNSGTTPSSGTGPSKDHTSGTGR